MIQNINIRSIEIATEPHHPWSPPMYDVEIEFDGLEADILAIGWELADRLRANDMVMSGGARAWVMGVHTESPWLGGGVAVARVHIRISGPIRFDSRGEHSTARDILGLLVGGNGDG